MVLNVGIRTAIVLNKREDPQGGRILVKQLASGNCEHPCRQSVHEGNISREADACTQKPCLLRTA